MPIFINRKCMLCTNCVVNISRVSRSICTHPLIYKSTTYELLRKITNNEPKMYANISYKLCKGKLFKKVSNNILYRKAFIFVDKIYDRFTKGSK